MLIPKEITASSDEIAQFLKSLRGHQDFVVAVDAGSRGEEICQRSRDLSPSQVNTINDRVMNADHVFVTKDARSVVPPHFGLSRTPEGVCLTLYIGHCDANTDGPTVNTIKHDFGILAALLDVLDYPNITIPVSLSGIIKPGAEADALIWTRDALEHL